MHFDKLDFGTGLGRFHAWAAWGWVLAFCGVTTLYSMPRGAFSALLYLQFTATYTPAADGFDSPLPAHGFMYRVARSSCSRMDPARRFFPRTCLFRSFAATRFTTCIVPLLPTTICTSCATPDITVTRFWLYLYLLSLYRGFNTTTTYSPIPWRTYLPSYTIPGSNLSRCLLLGMLAVVPASCHSWLSCITTTYRT